jgi:type II secretory pathway pseudopilin PulG
MEKGSILILTMVAVLILSIMVTGLLTVGTTEVQTTQNYHLTKDAYYMAVQGMEEIRKEIKDKADPSEVENISRSPFATTTINDYGVSRMYITGTLRDLESGASDVKLTGFPTLPLPPLTGVSLSASFETGMVTWKIDITSKIESNSKITYSELTAGVMGLTSKSY